MDTSFTLKTGLVLCYENRKGTTYFRSLTSMMEGRMPVHSSLAMKFVAFFSIEAAQPSTCCFTFFQACTAREMDMETGKETYVSIFFDQPYFDRIIEVAEVLVIGVNPTVSYGDSTKRYIHS